MMKRIKIFKKESNKKLVDNLRTDGYLIDYEEIKKKTKVLNYL